MTLEMKTDPRKKLMLAFGLDALLIVLGGVLFAISGNALWLIGALAIGTAIAMPMIFSAMRDMKEQK